MNMHRTIDQGMIDQMALAKCAYDMMLVAIGMIDESWLRHYSPELQVRLQQLLDDPEG